MGKVKIAFIILKHYLYKAYNLFMNLTFRLPGLIKQYKNIMNVRREIEKNSRQNGGG